MSGSTDLASAVETVASNPKVATLVAASTASAGAATQFELMQGVLSIASMTIGIITAIVVLAIQLIKLQRNYRAWMAEKPEPGELE